MHNAMQSFSIVKYMAEENKQIWYKGNW